VQTRRFARRTASSFLSLAKLEPTPRLTIGLSYIPPFRAKKEHQSAAVHARRAHTLTS
jgi:hypothetical protein